MSVYAARGPTDNLASYNEVFLIDSMLSRITAAKTLMSFLVIQRWTRDGPPYFK